MRHVSKAAIIAATLLSLSGRAAFAQGTTTTEDTSRWRYLVGTAEMGILVSDVSGDDVRTLSTYGVLTAAHASGVDGFETRFETDCRTDQIKDLGGTAYTGAEARGTIPSRTNGQAIIVEPRTLYATIHAYACSGRFPESEGRTVTGRAAAVAYARTRMSGRR